MIFFFKFNQNVLLCLPHRATSVSHLLEPKIATIQTIAAAAIAKNSLVPLTQPLGLDSGGQHFALQQAVAARVSTMLLAPTGALIVTVVFYRSATQGHFLKFRAFLPIHLVFLFVN